MKSFKRRKPVEFFMVPGRLGSDLIKTKASWATWAMVLIISEAWYHNGYRRNRPDSFPLALCDTEKWGVSRLQKHRALKFLVGLGWIQIDRDDPQNPFVILARPDEFQP